MQLRFHCACHIVTYVRFVFLIVFLTPYLISSGFQRVVDSRLSSSVLQICGEVETRMVVYSNEK